MVSPKVSLAQRVVSRITFSKLDILNVLPAAAAPSGEHQRQILLLGVIAGNAAAVHLALVVAGVAIKGVVAIRIRAPLPQLITNN